MPEPISNSFNSSSNSFSNVWSNRLPNRDLIAFNTGNFSTTGTFIIRSPDEYNNDAGAQITYSQTNIRPFIYARNKDDNNSPTNNVFYKGLPVSGLLDITGSCITIQTKGLFVAPYTGADAVFISHYLDYNNSLVNQNGYFTLNVATGFLSETIQFQFLYSSGTKYVYRTSYEGSVKNGTNVMFNRQANARDLASSLVTLNRPLAGNRINPTPVLGRDGLAGGPSGTFIIYHDYRVYADRVDLDAGQA